MEFATDFWNLVFGACVNDAAGGFHSLWFTEDQESSLQPCLNTRMSQQWRPTLCIPCSTAFRRFLPQHQHLQKDTQQHPGSSAGINPCTSFLVVDEVRPPSIIFLSSRSESSFSLRQMFHIWRMEHVRLEISSNSWLHYWRVCSCWCATMEGKEARCIASCRFDAILVLAGALEVLLGFPSLQRPSLVHRCPLCMDKCGISIEQVLGLDRFWWCSDSFIFLYVSCNSCLLFPGRTTSWSVLNICAHV